MSAQEEGIDQQVIEKRPRVRVDVGERGSLLLELVLQSEAFDVRLAKLRVGDYAISDEIVIERKSFADLQTSIIDGRLFSQAARLAHEAARGLVLVEGRPPVEPRVHPNAITGAVLSLAIDWRLPVIFTDGPVESFLVLRLLAQRHSQAPSLLLARHDYKPKRLTSRRAHVLQGLPGVGPAIAQRILAIFGTVEAAMIADAEELAAVPGIGARKAEAIRNVLQ
jgi:Fanconi anemia group M protein